MTEYLTNTFKNDDLDEDFEAVSNQSLHDLLETITSVPHLAGDFQDLILADFVRQKFVEFGLDHAEVRFEPKKTRRIYCFVAQKSSILEPM